MRPHFFRGICPALTVMTCCAVLSVASPARAATLVTLEQPMHFTAADGTDVMAEAGTYAVDTPDGSRLQLNAEGRAPLFVEARAATHTE